MASSSSAHDPHHHLLLSHGATAAPPPTPSSQPNLLLSTTSSDSTADALASLLHRLPTTLSLPSSRFARRHSPSSSSSGTTNAASITAKADAPCISLSQPHADVLSAIAAASSDHGFFQLTHHRVTTQLAESGESNSAALLALPLDQKRRLFPVSWPIGFIEEDDVDDEPLGDENASLCLDLDCLTSIKPAELGVSGLTELTRELESLGVEVVEMLTCALGLENPPEKKSSLMWVSESDENGKAGMSGGTGGSERCYPYIVGLRYQIRSQEYRLEADTGPVLVRPKIGSVLVTLGDIAQVWSNGKTKKVRGRPILNTLEHDKDSISMSLLLTLPLDSTISPLLPIACINDNEDRVVGGKKRKVDNTEVLEEEEEKRVFKFNSIPFEDYAWRVYHERLFLKDSLDRYRILCD